jgi:hypothetical protein
MICLDGIIISEIRRASITEISNMFGMVEYET